MVPEKFARSTAAREGRAGTDWLARLPRLVDDLLERWGCVPDGVVGHGGVGLVVPVARRRCGTRAVLKVSFPHPGNVHEPDAFAVWRGRGAVLLYERDDERFGMLLERAGSVPLAGLADGDALVAVAGRVSRRLAVPAPPGLPRLSGLVGEWRDELREGAARSPHTMPAYAVDAALATVEDFGRDQPDLMVHGDLHARNILPAEREEWLAVDPKGYAGDPAHDGGTLLKSRAFALLEADDLGRAVRRVLDVFAEHAEVDRERLRRWAQFHAVQTALWGRRHGFGVARGGARLDRLTDLCDRLAGVLVRG